MSFYIGILIIVFLVIAFKIIKKILLNIEENMRKDMKNEKLKFGYISRKDLASVDSDIRLKNGFLINLVNKNPFLQEFPPFKQIYSRVSNEEFKDFIKWCSRYLESIEYSEGAYVSEGIFLKADDLTNCGYEALKDSRTALLKYRHLETQADIYVQCVLLKQVSGNDAAGDDKWPELSLGCIQKFTGTMLGDKIYKGLFITTGDFSPQVREFIETLPKPYEIQLLDGIEITKKHRQVVSMELKKIIGNA
ncbi:MAG: restriction endonuclease [Bacillota bacterium]|nr:restriction endonuclease [Bacillota bacterium]